MTKEDYIKKKDFIRNEIRRLEDERKQLNREYLDSNFDKSLLNKKVHCYWKGYNYITGRDEKNYKGDGFVSGVEMLLDDIVYKINKIKKDGTMSNISAGYYGVNYVELIDE